MTTPLATHAHPTAETSGATARALLVAAAPVLLTAALLWHPPLPGRLPDSAGVAEAASADLTRWGLSHLALALASGLIAVAFVAVRGYLRERGDGSASAIGLGLVLIGSVLFAVLPGMEFAVLAAHETGTDLAATQTALEPWFVPLVARPGHRPSRSAPPSSLGPCCARSASTGSPRSWSPSPS